MKTTFKIILTLCCMLQLQLASAQSAEIQQLLLNVEKLAQFKQILSDMKKGYEVISKGYSTVKNIAEGNFNLHQKFLDGLLSINPALKKYKRVPDIINGQRQLLDEYKSAFNAFRAGGRFQPAEIDYMQKVYSNLFDRSLENLEELTMIVTASKLRMSDEERLIAIDRIHVDMQEKLSFLRAFNKQQKETDAHRKRALKDLDILSELDGKH